MAQRLYTKNEFENELKNKLGLTPTDQVTGSSRAWRTKNSKYVLVPERGRVMPELGERYPDNWIAEIYTQVSRLEKS